jgi:hypothetical protein
MLIDHFSSDVGEACRELGRGLVASLAGKKRVAVRPRSRRSDPLLCRASLTRPPISHSGTLALRRL